MTGTDRSVLHLELHVDNYRIQVLESAPACFAVELHADEGGRWRMIRGEFRYSSAEDAKDRAVRFMDSLRRHYERDF